MDSDIGSARRASDGSRQVTPGAAGSPDRSRIVADERAITSNGQTVIDSPTERPGKIRFICGRGRSSGAIEVVP